VCPTPKGAIFIPQQMGFHVELDPIESPLRKYWVAKRRRNSSGSSSVLDVSEDDTEPVQTMASDVDQANGFEGQIGIVNISFRATLQHAYSSSRRYPEVSWCPVDDEK